MCSSKLLLADGRSVPLNGVKTEEEDFGGSQYLTDFRLDSGLPVWTYEVAGMTIEKRVYLPHRQNTTYINYRVAGGSGSVKLQLRPAVNMREHEAPVNTPLGTYTITVRDHHYELKASLRHTAAAHDAAWEQQSVCNRLRDDSRRHL